MLQGHVNVTFPNGHSIVTNPQAMSRLAGDTFPVASRVPGVPGDAFDLSAWYDAALESEGEAGVPALRPTHLLVRAADGFEAIIPATQLSGALFQYSVNGTPLEKGGPLRLYVPDGTSACLNVKSVADIRFATDRELGEEAGYGHRHIIRRIR